MHIYNPRTLHNNVYNAMPEPEILAMNSNGNVSQEMLDVFKKVIY